MLGFIFRGIFLIGILTWYSGHVWKLIDGYFKDQFRSYLEEEFRRNPRLRPDPPVVKVDPALDSRAKPTETTLQRLVEACDRDVCPVGQIGNDSEESAGGKVVGDGATESGTIGKIGLDEPGGTRLESGERNLTDGGPEETNAPEGPELPGSTDHRTMEGTAAEPDAEEEIRDGGDQREELKGEKEETERAISEEESIREATKEETKGVVEEDQLTTSTTESPRKRGKLMKKPAAEQRTSKKPRKKRVKTLILTEEDFASVKRGEEAGEADDFWEFEEDSDGEPVEGVLVSQLAFKPRLEIGELERVTADEFCPLTLEEQDSCDQTYSWL